MVKIWLFCAVLAFEGSRWILKFCLKKKNLNFVFRSIVEILEEGSLLKIPALTRNHLPLVLVLLVIHFKVFC